MRGRRKNQAKLNKLRGNPGRRKTRARTAAASPTSMPECPAHLTPEARREFRRICAELAARQLLASRDVGIIAQASMLWARLVKLEKQIDRQGVTYINRTNGLVKSHPAIRIVHQIHTLLLRTSDALLLSPLASLRLSADPPAAKDDFEEFLTDGAAPAGFDIGIADGRTGVRANTTC